MPIRTKGATGVTDHGLLTGLADDDHSQYILVDGTRAFSGDVDFGNNRLDNLGAIDFPAAGTNPVSPSTGDVYFNTADTTIRRYNGSTWDTFSSSGTDHGALTGLADDDHTQYILVDGTRAFTGAIDMGNQAVSNVGSIEFPSSGSNPGSPTSGDVYWNTGDDTLRRYNGSTWDNLTGGVTDHGVLTGLADDDHAQYILVDGTRAFTGDVSVGGNRLESIGQLEVPAASSDPGSPESGDVYWNTSSNNMKRYNGSTWDDLTGTGSGVTDHGALSGLADDDHAQYLLIDGTRAMTGDLDVGGNRLDDVGAFDVPFDSSDPVSPTSGDMYWNTTDDMLKRYNGSTWDVLTAAGDVTGSLSANTVTALQGNAVGTATPSGGDILIWTGSEYTPITLGGDVTINGSAVAKVTALQDYNVEDHPPQDGEVLTWVAANSQWEPTAGGGGGVSDHGALTGLTDDDHERYFDKDGSKAATGDFDLGGNDITNLGTGEMDLNASNPGSPRTGQVYFNTATEEVRVYNGSTWEKSGNFVQVSGNDTGYGERLEDKIVAGTDISVTVLNEGADESLSIAYTGSSGDPTLGGDLAGTASNATVEAIQGTAVSATPPTATGQVLEYDGVDWDIGGQKLDLAGGTMSGAINMGGNELDNIGDITLPNATSSGGLPAAADGNFGLRIDSGSDRFGLYISDGTNWEPLPITWNASGRIAGDYHPLDGNSQFVIPNHSSAPTALDDGDFYYNTTDDNAYFRDNGASAWRKVQYAQKFAYHTDWYYPSGRQDNEWYHAQEINTADTNPVEYDVSAGTGTYPSTTSNPEARGFMMPEAGTVTRVAFNCYFANAGASGTVMEFAVQRLRPDYASGQSVTHTRIGNGSVQPDGEWKFDTASLSTTAVEAGDILVPYILCSDETDIGDGAWGNFTITIEVND